MTSYGIEMMEWIFFAVVVDKIYSSPREIRIQCCARERRDKGEAEMRPQSKVTDVLHFEGGAYYCENMGFNLVFKIMTPGAPAWLGG